MSPTMRRPRLPDTRAWLDRWGPVLPLFVAEFIAWTGYGALLPVMPLYFRDHGVDIELLGIVIAAWPLATLVGQPAFGWLADRTSRTRIMVAGLIVTAVALALPLVLTSAPAFIALRALAGFGTSAYDPAARGYLTDATPPERRGEAFGLYGAGQMAGLLLGPAIGGLGAAATGSISFVFVLGALTTLGAAIAVALRVHEREGGHSHVGPSIDFTEFPAEAPWRYERAAAGTEAPGASPSQPRRLVNRLLVASLVLNLGSYLAGGTYEVIWSLFLERRGASLEFIGLTFALFGLPVLVLSPYAGKLVDRRAGISLIVAGSLAMAIASVSYPFVPDLVWVLPLLVLEASGFALLNPALYALVAAGSPSGRSSTAQGLFGAAGTMGTIVASVLAGYLAASDIRLPFFASAIAMMVCLAFGLTVGGRAIRRLADRPAPALEPAPAP
jgi:MFS family permease